MVVHIGVVVIAVALASATSYAHRGQLTLKPGQQAQFDGIHFRYIGMARSQTAASDALQAVVKVDGRGMLKPADTQFGSNTDPVASPAISSGAFEDVYLVINSLTENISTGTVDASGPVSIGVTVQPLVSWLWVGGLILVVGSALACVPGDRRRPTDPVSAPVPAVQRAEEKLAEEKCAEEKSAGAREVEDAAAVSR